MKAADAALPPAPFVIGVRHHSPACARLVAARIRARRPRYVLIEGPADFNARLDELALPHRLPVAIYSYLSSAHAHQGSWTPFAEHSPEWQALLAAREVGAEIRFIDLPAWHAAFHGLENRYADAADAEHEARAEAYERELTARLAVEGRDALWDHLFEDTDATPEALDALELRLSTYFSHLRNPAVGSAGNAAREAMMANWIAWAVARVDGRSEDVLVVCGGYHAPALATLWREMPTDLPTLPQPGAHQEQDTWDASGPDSSLRHGSYLVPYTYKRLDAFSGYASGMPSPAYYQWHWESGADGAARRMLEQVLRRLRERGLPASTADLMAVQVRAEGLSRLRGHVRPLRCDWLDALAGALVKDALDVPLPWTYRGALRAGTDPVLVETMDVLAGNAAGVLAPGTPQPPLVHSVQEELAAQGIVLRGRLKLDLLDIPDRARSRVLHRLALLGIPGIDRRSGPAHALSGQREEQWQLSEPFEQQAALIEAGAWGATLADAARAKLEDTLRAAAGRIERLVEGLERAAWAGLPTLSERLLASLPDAVEREPRFEALAPALGVLHTLLRHGDDLGMAGAPALRIVVEAGFDRALWLLEPPATIAPADTARHLDGYIALRRLVADALAGTAHAAASAAITGAAIVAASDAGHPDAEGLAIEPARALAVWRRKAADPAAAPASRGAALGALLGFADRLADIDVAPVATADAIALLEAIPLPVLGDALGGLLALARDTLAEDPGFTAGMDKIVRSLDDADFVQALPSLRNAFAWLPPRERGRLAEQVLALHRATHLPAHALTSRAAGDAAPEVAARSALIERRVIGGLQHWGLGAGDPPCR